VRSNFLWEIVVKNPSLLAASAIALAAVAPMPAAAQHAGHSTHSPAPAKPAAKKPAKQPVAKKPVKKPVAKKKPASRKPTAIKPVANVSPLSAAAEPVHQHVAPPAPGASSPVPAPVVDHSAHVGHAAPAPVEPVPAPAVDHSAHVGHARPAAERAATAPHEGHMSLGGALGPYPMNREASGTAWQPDTSHHTSLMRPAGDWTLMGHGMLTLVYDDQGGRRGDDKLFVPGMLMGMARRPLGNGTVQFKAMVSPDPLMGKSGYPLLLASGETADGVEHLIDRQHPHDFFMELSGSISQNIGRKGSVFVYAGLPGEPAFGPPAFMHREAILDSPEAPISHHWLDSTHIVFGVVTGGLVLGRAKIELSRFNGREPDQHRWNIETGPLDSTAARLSWNPTDTLSLQGSWGRFIEPEQLEPEVNQTRWSASALYAREVAPGWKLAGTLAWGRKSIKHHSEWLNDDAYVAEASLKHGGWTWFGRGEVTENRELLEGEEHGPAFRVGKLSAGAVRDLRIAKHLTLGVGGLLSVNFVPNDLAPEYGGNSPTGVMGFLRLKLD
jgi:hypothetical protein